MPVTLVNQQLPAPYYAGSDYNINMSGEPFYQNNHRRYHEKKHKRPKSSYYELQFSRSYPLPQPTSSSSSPPPPPIPMPIMQSMPIINGFEPAPTSSTGSGGAGSSSASSGISSHRSNRALLAYERRFNFSYALLILSIYCLVMSVIAIAITFIFPFWITVTIKPWENSVSQNLINITNLANQVSLITDVSEREENGSMVTILPIIKFDLGIWEVKMYQDIDLVDSSGSSSNSFPQSMLWLGADSISTQAFLTKFSQFINLKTANLFTIQILEIMHLIFTVLALSFTSFTLCLCASRKSAICWYLVCFFLSSVSFLNGLAVIILVLLWQTSIFQGFQYQLTENQTSYKSLGWCFWVAVGAISSIFLAALHTLIYIFIACCIYNRSELDRMRRETGVAAMLAYRTKNGMVYEKKPKKMNSGDAAAVANYAEAGGGGGGGGIENMMLNESSRFPRMDEIQQQSVSLQQQQQLQQIYKTAASAVPNAQMQSPSYIFYKGHGNFEKKVLGPNEELMESRHQEYITTLTPDQMLQQQRIANYATMLIHQHQQQQQQQQQQQGNHQLIINSEAINYDNHPYSNVLPDNLNPHQHHHHNHHHHH